MSLWAYLIFSLAQNFDTELSVVRDKSCERFLGSLPRGQKKQVGSNSSLSNDKIMLFPIEIVHLTIVARTYYFYLDTVNGTNNLRDLNTTKFSESNYGLCCFLLSFRNYYKVRSHLCNMFAKFVCL